VIILSVPSKIMAILNPPNAPYTFKLNTLRVIRLDLVKLYVIILPRRVKLSLGC